jgi:hypothetical protein
MKAKLGFSKPALVLGGLLIGTAGVALAPTAANARNFIGVDVGPLSVGIGANEPDYYVAPPPATTYVAPAPSTTYVQPAPTTYVAPSPPVVYQAPAATYDAPRTSTTTTTTYYRYPNTTTYYSYQPGYYAPPQTATTYYGQ